MCTNWAGTPGSNYGYGTSFNGTPQNSVFHLGAQAPAGQVTLAQILGLPDLSDSIEQQAGAGAIRRQLSGG